MLTQGQSGDGEVYMLYVAHAPVDLACPDDGLTRQEFRDECDINVLMAGYERTGVISHVNAREPMYLDVSNVPNLAEALQIFDEASVAFMSLPASVRREFDNDAVRFVEFASNPENLGKLREWGLARPVGEPPPASPERSAAAPSGGDGPSGSPT